MSYTEILVISVGATPQVVTETLYHYTYHELRNFNKIIMITTSTGRDKIEKDLFKRGKINDLEMALSKDTGFFPIELSGIVVLKNSDGKELDDIRTSEDCEDEMKHVFEILNGLTDEENNRLTVVVAGGRKTMSATMALGTSLFGRPQDEMIHVIIPQELFNNDDWYFPSDPNDPKQKIEIMEIPYLRTKNFIKGLDMSNPIAAIELTQTRINELAPLTKVIIDGNEIKTEGDVYKLPPAEMQIWRYLARKKTEECERAELEYCGQCNECYSTHFELREEFDKKIADEYFIIVPEHSAKYETREKQINKKKGLLDLDATVRQLKSKLKAEIRKRVTDPRIFHQLQVVEESINGDSSNKGVGIKLDKGAIEFKK